MVANRQPTADELNGVKQDTVQWPAKAHRITSVLSDGSEVTDSNPTPVDSLKYNSNFIDEASETLTYICMENKNGDWWIKKIDTSSGNSFQHATIANNATVLTYTDAFTDRATLTYGDYGGVF